jgi:hypothetical protein
MSLCSCVSPKFERMQLPRPGLDELCQDHKSLVSHSCRGTQVCGQSIVYNHHRQSLPDVVVRSSVPCEKGRSCLKLHVQSNKF